VERGSTDKGRHGRAAGTARGLPDGRAKAFIALLCAASTALAGCLGNGGEDEPRRIKGDIATIYSSAPRHGVSATTAAEVVAGERRALAERGGHAGDLRIRFRQLPATDDRERAWDPALVAENAQRAADDPTAIAYLGELDYGATAVSLPITNDAGLLQVSPGDGLTSLTQRPPGRPRAGPGRYYPAGRRTFVRIGPTDLDEAESLVARLASAGERKFAIVFDREIYGRELAAQVVARARRADLRPVAAEEYRGQTDDIPDIVRALAEDRPDAVVHLGVAGRGTIPMLVAIDDELPGVPLFASSGILALPQLALPARPSRIEAVGPALTPEQAGYEAMRLVLDAVAMGGRDRRRVVSAAIRLGRDRPADPVALYRPDERGRFARVATE
jgi:ABC-type branched-subunit amino acid transport system substrate-binding protein